LIQTPVGWFGAPEEIVVGGMSYKKCADCYGVARGGGIFNVIEGDPALGPLDLSMNEYTIDAG
jgi:hypothetical protein